MIEHYFFDMDGTLTESRQQIDGEMKDLVDKLSEVADVIIVSGARMPQIVKQLGGLVEYVATLEQNGNVARDSAGNMLWMNELEPNDQVMINDVIEAMIAKNPQKRKDLVENRGSQISYSAIGHDAPRELKEAYDPKGHKRQTVLAGMSTHIARLFKDGIQCAIGGTTCIDFFRFTKGDNVQRYITHQEYRKAECMYIGDALYSGGNDESVLGIHLKCLDVYGPQRTKEFIKAELLKHAEKD